MITIHSLQMAHLYSKAENSTYWHLFSLMTPSQTPKYGFSYLYIFLLNCPPPILYVRPIITTIIKKYIYTNLEKHIKMGKSAISPYRLQGTI